MQRLTSERRMQIRSKKPSNEKLKVLLVDDHRLILDAVSLVLNADPTIDVEVASSFEDAVEKIDQVGRFDAILLDYQIPGMSGLEPLRSMIKKNDGGVALFSGTASWPVIQNAVDHGASGYIPKTMPMRTMLHAIRFIAEGEVYLPYEYMKKVSNEDLDEIGLKPRERHVLAFLCEGMQNKEIGREVGIEEVIVKMDVKSICKKLGVRNRTEAALEARRRGIY